MACIDTMRPELLTRDLYAFYAWHDDILPAKRESFVEAHDDEYHVLARERWK